VNYKEQILQSFKEMEDPYAEEFVGERFDYEQNPSEPTNP